MKKFSYLILCCAARAAGGHVQQRAVRAMVRIFNYVMGVGSGGSPKSSGEIAVLKLVRKRLCPNFGKLCAFDVGANHGQFLSVLLKEFSGIDFVVHVFEPGGTAFRQLSSSYNASAGVRLNNIGLSNEAGKSALFSDMLGSGMSSLHKRDNRHLGLPFSETESIELTTLDIYLAANDIQTIDFLKMDVEGVELSVLQGGLKAFDSGRIRSVLFEFGGCNIDSRTYFRDFFYFFHQFDKARIYRVTPSGFLTPIRQYAEDLEQFTTTNFFVVLDPRMIISS